MRVAIIGRSEIMYQSALDFMNAGYEIGVIITSRETPEYKVTAQDFEQLAQTHEIPFFKTPKILELEDALKELMPMDIGISYNYNGIIPEDIIQLFPLGILNAHGGDLPRYRGNACQAWAIINGEDRIGLCVHRMIGGELDSGDIIAREYLPIDINTRIGAVHDWMCDRVPNLFLQAAGNLHENPDFILEKQSKDPVDILRCYPRVPDDGHINWSKSNEDVLRLINASGSPYQGAFCYLGQTRITIHEAELVFDNEIYLGIPGQVSSINHNSEFIEVLCGSGKIRILSASIDGQIIRLTDIINSLRMRLI